VAFLITKVKIVIKKQRKGKFEIAFVGRVDG